MTWNTPDGQRAVKILDDAGMLQWRHGRLKCRLSLGHPGVVSTGMIIAQHRCELIQGPHREVWAESQMGALSTTPVLDWRCSTPHFAARRYSDHEAECILRDAARRYTKDGAVRIAMSSDYDAALIAAVFAVHDAETED